MSNAEINAQKTGYEEGRAAASGVTDGNTDQATYLRILTGYEEGDCLTMDLQPSPLSGEWAGESIKELSAKFDLDLEDENVALAFEMGYSEGFWDELIRVCRYHVGQGE